MVYLRLQLQDDVLDDKIMISFENSNPPYWHWIGDYTHLHEFGNMPAYHQKTIIVACNSDTVIKLREMLGGSFGHVSYFPIPVPVGMMAYEPEEEP